MHAWLSCFTHVTVDHPCLILDNQHYATGADMKLPHLMSAWHNKASLYTKLWYNVTICLITKALKAKLIWIITVSFVDMWTGDGTNPITTALFTQQQFRLVVVSSKHNNVDSQHCIMNGQQQVWTTDWEPGRTFTFEIKSYNTPIKKKHHYKPTSDLSWW